jgi:hypothetical protein
MYGFCPVFLACYKDVTEVIMASNSKVDELAGRLREAQAMGRSESLKLLFEFLVARSANTVAPKEVEIAAAIFGAASNFDGSQDASVRVYIHRLRQKLDDYYSGPGRGEAERLIIPKGVGYRVMVETRPSATPGVAAPAPRRWVLKHWAMAAGLAALLLANAIAWVILRPQPAAPSQLDAIRANPVWSSLLSDSRAITVVVGDYYIFGEVVGADGSNRLVREYSINSPQDLDSYLMQNPGMSGRYMDLDLYYLPVSIAFALRSIMPVLAPAADGRDRIHVIQASELTPDMIKRTNILYIGYFSGLGLLRELVFSGSRFTVGDTYDELIDSVSKHHFISQEGGPDQADQKLRDYGYFSAFTGPNGNHFMVIAGTRDIAVMQMAETVTASSGLTAMSRAAKSAPDYEALYEVEGIRRINLGSRLLMVSPLSTEKIWNASPSALRFPNG